MSSLRGLASDARHLSSARPLLEASSPHTGALDTLRACRSLGYPALIQLHLDRRKRRRGCCEAQMIESIVLLQTIRGQCPQDINMFRGDLCLQRGLGHQPPKPTAVREFLELFHDPLLEQQRPSRERQLSSIMAYNIASAIKDLCFSPAERRARMKRYRLLAVHMCLRCTTVRRLLQHRTAAGRLAGVRFAESGDLGESSASSRPATLRTGATDHIASPPLRGPAARSILAPS